MLRKRHDTLPAKINAKQLYCTSQNKRETIFASRNHYLVVAKGSGNTIECAVRFKTPPEMDVFTFVTCFILFCGTRQTQGAAYVSRVFDVRNCGNL